jgi:hypothetical protein
MVALLYSKGTRWCCSKKMKQRFLRPKTRKHIETGRTSATEQRELVQAKEKPWAQSAMGAVKGKSKSETASRELHSEMNQHQTNNWLLHLLCDGKSNQ